MAVTHIFIMSEEWWQEELWSLLCKWQSDSF